MVSKKSKQYKCHKCGKEYKLEFWMLEHMIRLHSQGGLFYDHVKKKYIQE